MIIPPLVSSVKRPLQLGEYYMVPCVVRETSDAEVSFTDPFIKGVLYITPVIDHPHNDLENGQPEVHYHTDYRFVRVKKDGPVFHVIRRHGSHYFVESSRPQIIGGRKIEFFILPVVNEYQFGITPVHLISKSKIKHHCIYKGKCPHRGYDLSQTKSSDGVITCPLHGLQFDSKSRKLLNFK